MVEISKLYIRASDKIREVISVIDKSERISLALVVDDDERLLNTITDGDVRRGIMAGINLESPCSHILEIKLKTPHPYPVTARYGSAHTVLKKIMDRERIRQLPLVDDDGKVKDIVIFSDLFETPSSRDVNVLIMAGGRGVRLSPLTDNVPKPLLPVNGIPILHLLIEQLSLSSFKDIYISTNYLSEKIEHYFLNGKNFGVNIQYLHEETPLGTAGALALLPYPRKTTLLINGDLLTTLKLESMINFHRDNRAKLTMAVVSHCIEIPFGVVESKGYKVTKVKEKPEITCFVNAGMYAIEPDVFDSLTPGIYLDATEFVTQFIERGGEVFSFPILEYWSDIGEHKSYQRVKTDFKSHLKTCESPGSGPIRGPQN